MKKKVFILLVLIISFISINVYAEDGWATENGEIYYYENGEKVTGWKTIDGETYFFGLTTNKLLHGWQYWNGKFYLDEEGKVTQGWNEIDGEKYYVVDNYMVNEFQNIDGETYFLGLTTYKLIHGWQYWNGKFYLDEEGKVTQGWNEIDGEKYYVVDNYMVNKFQEIDGETYFFGLTTYKLLHGWQYWNGYFYCDEETGIVPKGWFTKNENKYYFQDNYAVTGINEIEEKNYYFTNEGVLIEKTTSDKYKTIVIDENGEFVKIQYTPTYYNQKDSRWVNIKYGLSTIGSTGCTPTSIAMTFTSYLEKEITPIDVAYYLYHYTDQYNKRLKGTSGMGIIYAANNYKIQYRGIDSEEQLIEELKNGKIVIASMQDGTFATSRWNHSIVVFDYDEENNTTFVYDPLNINNNKWHEVSIIWDEQNQDPDDRTGGSALYAFDK